MTTRQAEVNGIPVHFAEHGSGTPVVALHGVGVDHREMAASLEPVFAGRPRHRQTGPGYRRIYPDLPGMGRTPAPEAVAGSDDVVEVLLGFVDAVVGDQPFLVAGHSYGGYLARAVANRRPGQVTGLALLCTAAGRTRDDELPEHVVLHTSGDLAGRLDPAMEAEYRDYLVVQTPETLQRFEDAVVPGMTLTDQAALERIFQRWELRTPPEQGPPYPNPPAPGRAAGRQRRLPRALAPGRALPAGDLRRARPRRPRPPP